MRIAILNLTGGGMSGGYQTYIESLLPRLSANKMVKAILCVAPKTITLPQYLSQLPKVFFANCRPFRPMRHHPDSELIQTLRQFSPNIIFIPVERYWRIPGLPTVVMVQNMGPLVPHTRYNPLSEKIRYALQKYEAKFAVKHADLVIAPSQFVQNFLIQNWKIPAERTAVIYYGSDHIDLSAPMKKPALVSEKWANTFLFTAGSIEPYRGLEDIFSALEKLKNVPELSGVIIAGLARKNMLAYQKKIKHWLVQHGLAEKVIWAGNLSKAEMDWCYHNCRAFIMTSRVESLSVISLEALAHRCVAIVANNPPFPEVFEKAAIYYPPGNGLALAQKIETVWQWDKIKIEAARDHFKTRANAFSWDVTTENTISEFAKCIKRYDQNH